MGVDLIGGEGDVAYGAGDFRVSPQCKVLMVRALTLRTIGAFTALLPPVPRIGRVSLALIQQPHLSRHQLPRHLLVQSLLLLPLHIVQCFDACVDVVSEVG